MAVPPHHGMIGGHCTWFSGRSNYPQATGTLPTQRRRQEAQQESAVSTCHETVLGGMSLRQVLVCPLSTPGRPQSVPPCVGCCGDSAHSTLAVCAVQRPQGMPPCHAVDRHPRSPWALAPETTLWREQHGV